MIDSELLTRLTRCRALYERDSENARVRERLAMALFNAFADSEEDDDRRDGFLQELRILSCEQMKDASVRYSFSLALVNGVNVFADDLNYVDHLLEELYELQIGFPHDANVRESYARGLYNAIGHWGADAERGDRFLQKLLTLREDFPYDAAVTYRLLLGLFFIVQNCAQTGQHERGAEMRKKLESLRSQVERIVSRKPNHVLSEALALTAPDTNEDDTDAEA